jgi:hypothetical protein
MPDRAGEARCAPWVLGVQALWLLTRASPACLEPIRPDQASRTFIHLERERNRQRDRETEREREREREREKERERERERKESEMEMDMLPKREKGERDGDGQVTYGGDIDLSIILFLWYSMIIFKMLRPHYTFYFSIIFIRIELKSSLEFYYIYDLNIS